MTPYRVEAAPPDSSVANAPITTDRFRAALRFPTISTQDSASFDPARSSSFTPGWPPLSPTSRAA